MVDQIRPSQLADWLIQVQPNGTPLVLDVREPAELHTASIKADGFELQTIPMSVLGARLHELDRSRPVACLCHHGGRSMQVANFLIHHGFARVANISGGIHAWSQELDPPFPVTEPHKDTHEHDSRFHPVIGGSGCLVRYRLRPELERVV